MHIHHRIHPLRAKIESGTTSLTLAVATGAVASVSIDGAVNSLLANGALLFWYVVAPFGYTTVLG